MKKRMKSIIAAILAITLVGVSGCGSSKEEKTEKKAENDGVLNVAIWEQQQEPGLTKILEAFTEKTGIKAKIQVTPWNQYWTMLEAGATGETLPDVFLMSSDEMANYAEYEMMLDLTEKIEKSDLVDLSKFPEEIVEIYHWEDGKQYAIPKDVDTIALWYNKTLFDEAGVEYPDAEWTWEDFRSACEKLTNKEKDQYGYFCTPTNNHAGWYNMVYSMGGKIISDDKKTSMYNDPNTIKALEFATDLVKDGYTPSYEVMTENPSTTLFESGKIAMTTEGSWMLTELCNNDYVKENCDVTLLPKDADEGKNLCVMNGVAWAAAANTSRPDDAWALIEYLSSEEAQQLQAEYGVAIPAYSGTEGDWIQAYPDFNVRAYLDMKENVVVKPYSNSTRAWENVSFEKLISAFTGETEVKDVCNSINEEMNAILSEE